MKTLYFFLFSFVLFGLTESFAQGSMGGGATQPGGNQNAPAPNSGVSVSLRTSKSGAATTVNADNLKGLTRKGLRFQLLDSNGKAVVGGEKRIKYTESDGNVVVDIVGLPPAPRGKNYRMKITGADNAVTNVDLK
ncbi:MAG: hypothetical protein IPM34_13940 [Saprospiraceae bacterium]|nr:hypothetical protein [Saprospiraceae bacterium]